MCVVQVTVVSPEDVSAEMLAKEREVEMGKEDLKSKPEAVRWVAVVEAAGRVGSGYGRPSHPNLAGHGGGARKGPALAFSLLEPFSPACILPLWSCHLIPLCDFNFRAKIVEGRVQKIRDNMALLNQQSLRDPTKTVQDTIKETIAALGEKISVSLGYSWGRVGIGEHWRFMRTSQ